MLSPEPHDSHFILQADLGPDDVGGTADQAEGEMQLGAGLWEAALVPPGSRLWAGGGEMWVGRQDTLMSNTPPHGLLGSTAPTPVKGAMSLPWGGGGRGSWEGDTGAGT